MPYTFIKMVGFRIYRAFLLCNLLRANYFSDTGAKIQMVENRRPGDCRSYPFCEHLKSVLENVPGDLVITRTIVLQREAESVCSHCEDFEPR